MTEKSTDAATAVNKAISAIDKAAKKNTIHKNTAARRKSQLQKTLAKSS
jgi:small subunit ribosomal protein S20